jgi:hypothetical protein
LLNVLSYEEVANKFFGIEEEDAGKLEDPDEDTDKEEPRIRRGKVTNTPEPEPEEDKPVRRHARTEAAPKSEPEPEEDKPVRRTVRGEAKAEESEKCPYKHRFGIDTDKFDDCDKCKIWDDCIEEKEKGK